MVRLRRVGAHSQHLSCFLEAGGVTRKAIGFGLGGLPVSEGNLADVVYTVENEVWQERTTVSCRLQRVEPK